MIKKCNWCNKEFEDNTSNNSKMCCSKTCTNKLWYQNNKKKIQDKKETRNKQSRERYIPALKCFCKECNKPLNRKTKYMLCKECYQKFKYKRDFERRQEYHKEYNTRNRFKINKRHKDRYNNDIKYRIQNCLRGRLREAIKKALLGKIDASAVRDLGCTIEEFILHIESKFYDKEDGTPMSWNNYGINGWHIDHIKPLSKFDLSDNEELKKACHYSNLQPLWAKDNLSKGNKYER